MSQDNQTHIPPPQASRRAILTAAPVAAAAALAGGTVANAVALAIPRTDGVDPIFVLISEHRAAYEEMAALSTGPVREDHDAAMGVAMSWSDSVLLRLLTTPPTTLGGVVALLQHFTQREWNDPDNHNILVGAVAGSTAMATAADDLPGNLADALRNIIARGQA
jgi:hypothetical protein